MASIGDLHVDRSVTVRAGMDADGYEKGAKKKSAADEKMIASDKALAAATQVTQRRTADVGKALERLRNQIDPAHRSQTQLARSAGVLNRALASGRISSTEHIRLMGLTRQRYDEVSTAATRATAATATAATSTSRLSAVTTSAQGALAGYAGRLGPLGSALAAIGPAGLVAGAGIAAVTAGLTAGLSVLRDYEKLEASLTTVTGSATAAAAAFARVRAFAAETPYSVEEVTGAFIKLKALGLDPSEAALRSYGNTAAGMSKSLDQMIEAIADATTGEFERLKEFGIRSSAEGNRVTFTFRGISTTVGKSADEIEGYLRKIGEVQFAGGMARQAATLDGALSNLTDAWREFLAEIAKASGARDASGAFLPWFTEKTRSATRGVATMTDINREIVAVGRELQQARDRLAEIGSAPSMRVARSTEMGNIARLEARESELIAKAQVAADQAAADAANEKAEADAAAAAKAEERAKAIANLTKEQDRELALARMEARVREEQTAADKAATEIRKEIADVKPEEVAAARARAIAIVRAERETIAAIESRNRALAESAKLEETMFLSDADAAAILENIQKQTLAYRDLIDGLDLEIKKKTEIAALQGLDAEARATEIALIETKYAAIAKGLPLDKAEIAAIRERIAAITKIDVATAAAEQAAKEWDRIWDQAARNVQDAFGDAWIDIFSGGVTTFADLSERIKSIMFQVAGQIAAALVFQPIINSTGLGGLIGGPGAAAAGGASLGSALGLGGSFGSAGGLLGGASAAMSLGNVLFNGASWTAGSDTLVSLAGQLGGYLGGTSGASSFAQAADAFSSPIGSIGSFAANMVLNQILGDRGIGSSVGSTIGGIAGSFLGLGPWGTVAGSALGNIIGGLFGGAKPSVGPNAYAESLIGPGGVSLWETGADNGGQAGPLADLSRQIGESFAAIVAQLGGTIAAGQQTNFHLGNFPSQGGVWAAVGGTEGRQSFGEDSEAAVRFILAGLFDALAIDGLGAEFEAAASQAIRLADSTEQMTADLEFLRAYFDDGLLSEETKSSGEQFMDALDKAFDEATASATRLGLSLDRVETMRADAITDFIDGFNQAQSDAIGAIEDPLAQAMLAFERYAEDLREQAAYLEQFGADVTLIERRIALERQQIIERFGQQATDTLRQWLDNQALTSTATTAMGRLAEGQAQFGALLDTIRGGAASSENMSQLTRLADSIIRSGQELYGGTAQRVALEQMVRSQIESLIPGFADGGYHAGGWRVVGERGPELEYTMPSVIMNAGQTQAMMAGGAGRGGEERERQRDRIAIEGLSVLRTIAAENSQLKAQIARLTTKLDGYINIAAAPKRKAS